MNAPDKGIPPGMDMVASRYAELWRAVRSHEGAPREAADARFLLDQVRSALDRHAGNLAEVGGNDLIANSFMDEGVVHAGDRVHVHRLRHRDLGTHHAMKTLAPDHADTVSAGFILREARLVRGLRHPAIVAAEALLRLPDGRPALVMEWLGDGNVADLLMKGSPVSAAALHRMASDLLGGLAVIHEAGLVHADISPRNLLLAEGDGPALKIADFGIALELGESHSSLGIRKAGTPGFDDDGNGTADPKRDLRAAGKVVTLMLERLAPESDVPSRLSEIAAMLQDGKGVTARDAFAMLEAA